MQNLFQHITELLSQHSCVVVPGFGGFVPNFKSAQIDEKNGKFCPPSAEVLFNPHLCHNDGLLIQAYANQEQISFDEASTELENAVNQLKANIDAKGEYKVKGFGTFYKEGKSYTFVSDESCMDNADSFGLTGFYFSALNKTDKSKSERRQNIKYALTGASVAAALLGVVFIAPMFGGSDLNSQLASFVPITVPQKVETVATTQVERPAEQMEVSQPVQEDAPQQKADEEKDDTKDTEEETHTFYLALSQFNNLDDANSFVERHQTRLSDTLKVVKMGNTYVVACASTSDFELANRMLNHVQTNSSFKKSFLVFK